MNEDDPLESITRMLNEAHQDQQTRSDAYLALKAQLKSMAERQMTDSDERSVEASHVVNHVFVKLTEKELPSFPDRSRFFAYACKEIRTYLIDRARRRQAAKRNKGRQHADLEVVGDVAGSDVGPDAQAELNDELLKLERVLPSLEQSHPELFAVVNLHFFGELSFEQLSKVLLIDAKTARRRWEKARLILQREMLMIASDGEPS